MRIRLGYIAVALLLLISIVAAVALTHMNNLPAFIAIAPGYLVQAWLFETHRALGGFCYQVTMVGGSAVVWTLIIFSAAVGVRLVRRLVPLARAAQPPPRAVGARAPSWKCACEHVR